MGFMERSIQSRGRCGAWSDRGRSIFWVNTSGRKRKMGAIFLKYPAARRSGTGVPISKFEIQRRSIDNPSMAANWDTFERYKQKGLDARRAGQWDSARIYLLEAARAMLELSKQAQGEELRDGRREISAKLLELAQDCQKA